MTLEQAKQQIAEERGFEHWGLLMSKYGNDGRTEAYQFALEQAEALVKKNESSLILIDNKLIDLEKVVGIELVEKNEDWYLIFLFLGTEQTITIIRTGFQYQKLYKEEYNKLPGKPSSYYMFGTYKDLKTPEEIEQSDRKEDALQEMREKASEHAKNICEQMRSLILERWKPNVKFEDLTIK